MPALFPALTIAVLAALACVLVVARARRWRPAVAAATAALEELHRDGDLFRSLIEHASDVVLVVSADGRVGYAGGAARGMLGHAPDELAGQELAAVVPGDEGRRLQALLAECVADPEVAHSLDLRIQRAQSGHWASFEAVAENRLADPGVGGVVIRLRDITKRKWAEEALRAAETKYRTLVEQLPLVTYLDNLDRYSSALYMSPQIEDLLGYSTEEWLADDRLFPKLLHPEDRERVMAEVSRSHESEDRFVCDYRLIARDGRVVWFHDEAVTIRDEDGRPLYAQGYMLDITARRQADGEA